MVKYTALKGQYELEKTIGCGGFAKVKLATHLLTGEKVAIKIMEKAQLGVDLPRVKLEMKALRGLSHHHICKLFQTIETDTHYFMVMEYCAGGELFDHIVERNRLSVGESRSFFRQIVSAVAYLHSLGFAHRDLKPENVLLDKDQIVKLIDFGLCAKPKGGMDSHLSTSCGSPTYAAPELVVGKKYLGSEIDIWSMGVLLYALLCGFLPFDDNDIGGLYHKILSGKYDEPEWLSNGSKTLIRSMLQVDPKKRITINKLLCHPWITMGYNKPVNKDTHTNYHSRDEECLEVMATYHRVPKNKLWTQLCSWKYDFDTSTYLLLLARKKRGLPVRLLASSRYPFRTKQIVDRTAVMDTTENNKSEFSSNLPKHVNETCSILKGGESTPDVNTPVIAIKKQLEEKENNLNSRRTEPHRRSMKRFRSPSLDITSPVNTPVIVIKAQQEEKENNLNSRRTEPHRRSMKRFRSPRLDNTSPVPAKLLHRQEGERTSRPGTPITNNRNDEPTTPNHTPSSARKVLGSIERGLNRVRHILTPRRRVAACNDRPAILGSKKLCNVSTASSEDPERVLNDLRRALNSKGISCKQKGFTLRGKVEEIVNGSIGDRNAGKSSNSKLTFELEVCLIPLTSGSTSSAQPPMVGILRKRLNGDAWCYKKVCEEVLALAATSTSY